MCILLGTCSILTDMKNYSFISLTSGRFVLCLGIFNSTSVHCLCSNKFFLEYELDLHIFLHIFSLSCGFYMAWI